MIMNKNGQDNDLLTIVIQQAEKLYNRGMLDPHKLNNIKMLNNQTNKLKRNEIAYRLLKNLGETHG